MQLDLTASPLEKLKGTVRALDHKPIDRVLVEVLDIGRLAPTQTDAEARSRPRVATCVTGTNGSFEFDLPSGRYEVLCSKADWNSTSVLVVIDRKRGGSRDIRVPLKVGD